MQQIFDKIPDSSVEYVKGLIFSEKIIFKLKKSRKTKHGDFSVKKNGSIYITINDDLNQYRFLITLIHELSHYFSYKCYGSYIKPHGLEWKNTFKKLLLPIINNDVFPDDILKFLSNYAKNPKASTDTDSNLSFALNSYNPFKSKYVEDLNSGTIFIASNKRKYKLIKKLRKRYECIDILNKKLYLFSPNAKVNKIINE